MARTVLNIAPARGRGPRVARGGSGGGASPWGAWPDLLGPGTGSRPLRLGALGMGTGRNSHGPMGRSPRKQSAGAPEGPRVTRFLACRTLRPADTWPLTIAVCSSARQTQSAPPGEATGQRREQRRQPLAAALRAPGLVRREGAHCGEGGGNLGRLPAPRAPGCRGWGGPRGPGPPRSQVSPAGVPLEAVALTWTPRDEHGFMMSLAVVNLNVNDVPN